MELIKKNKIYILIIMFILIIGIIIILINKKDNQYLSGNSESINLINEYLKNLQENLDKKNINYTFKNSKNDKIDSLIVKIEQLSEDEQYIIPYYVSYNVDRKNNIVLNKEEVAEYYGYKLDDIINKINERLQNYYNEEVKLGYVDSNECSFEQYKDFYRNIEDVEQIYELYVTNDKLYIYISFDINSMLDDIEYFNELKYDPFEIEL